MFIISFMYFRFYLDADFSFSRRRRGSLRGLPLGHPYPMRGAITPMATEVIAGYVTEDKENMRQREAKIHETHLRINM